MEKNKQNALQNKPSDAVQESKIFLAVYNIPVIFSIAKGRLLLLHMTSTPRARHDAKTADKAKKLYTASD